MSETTGNAATDLYLVLAQELMRRVYADMEPDELNDWLHSQLVKLKAGGSESALMTWAESFDRYEQILSDREAKANLPASERKELTWAWPSWNRMIDPLEPGLLAVIAAGDGMGKTIYCETQAEHWAKQGHRVTFVHFELNRAVMLDRRAARHTGISRRELKSGPFSDDLKARWLRARRQLEQFDGQVTYLHTPGWSMDRLVAELNRQVGEGECDVVVIDYLEKAQASSSQLRLFGANQNQREAHDVEQVKIFAESTKTPTLMLAQMSKAGKTAGIANLDRTAMRGAGEKSEKANIVVLLHREHDDEKGYAPLVDVRIDKNTLGPTGVFQQYMDGEHFRVFDLQEQR